MRKIKFKARLKRLWKVLRGKPRPPLRGEI